MNKHTESQQKTELIFYYFRIGVITLLIFLMLTPYVFYAKVTQSKTQTQSQAQSSTQHQTQRQILEEKDRAIADY